MHNKQSMWSCLRRKHRLRSWSREVRTDLVTASRHLCLKWLDNSLHSLRSHSPSLLTSESSSPLVVDEHRLTASTDVVSINTHTRRHACTCDVTHATCMRRRTQAHTSRNGSVKLKHSFHCKVIRLIYNQ